MCTEVSIDALSLLFTLESFAKVLAGVSVLCDWILATLPIVFLWNLQMKVRVKVGICALMGMGYLYDHLRGPKNVALLTMI